MLSLRRLDKNVVSAPRFCTPSTERAGTVDLVPAANPTEIV